MTIYKTYALLVAIETIKILSLKISLFNLICSNKNNQFIFILTCRIIWDIKENFTLGHICNVLIFRYFSSLKLSDSIILDQKKFLEKLVSKFLRKKRIYSHMCLRLPECNSRQLLFTLSSHFHIYKPLNCFFFLLKNFFFQFLREIEIEWTY